jgi:hypothetical protein
MTKWKSILPVVALALPLTAAPALAQSESYNEEVEFASEHPCTREIVEGDARVRMTITTTENDDGTTHVHITQHTHGQQLYGPISQDWYTFNEAQDTHQDETLFGPSGTVETRTIFIHTSESLAYQELAQGLDDFHQRLEVVFSPLLPPVVVKDTGHCK